MTVRTLRRGRARGFTLTELMIVVAIIGVLAALAIYGYRKYVDTASASEAKAVMQGIRASEEAYRSETLVYLSCSAYSDDRLFPWGKKPDNHKMGWLNTAHPDWPCWRRLNVAVDSPVRWGYAVVAGMPGPAPAAPPGFQTAPAFPAQTTEPWYVVFATADRDDDNDRALAVTASTNGEIYTEKEFE